MKSVIFNLRGKAKSLFAVALVAPAIALAGGGGGFSGATEPTQLMNNAELVAQYAKQAESVAVQISQYMTMLQNIQQLPGQVVGKLLPANLATLVTSYAKAYDAVNGAYYNGTAVANRMMWLSNTSQRMNLAPNEIVRQFVSGARQRGSYYDQQVQQSHSEMSALQNSTKEIQQIAASVPGITGNVEGLQALLSSNAKIAQINLENQSALIQMKQMMAEKEVTRQTIADGNNELTKRKDAAKLEYFNPSQKGSVVQKSEFGDMIAPNLK